jgi:hypothetical protein
MRIVLGLIVWSIVASVGIAFDHGPATPDCNSLPEPELPALDADHYQLPFLSPLLEPVPARFAT